MKITINLKQNLILAKIESYDDQPYHLASVVHNHMMLKPSSFLYFRFRMYFIELSSRLIPVESTTSAIGFLIAGAMFVARIAMIFSVTFFGRM